MNAFITSTLLAASALFLVSCSASFDIEQPTTSVSALDVTALPL